MATKKKVAVIGATGIAGQQFLACLAEHPWYEVSALAGSTRSAGKVYAEGIKTEKGATGWWADGDCPEKFKGMLIQDSAKFDAASVDIVFTAIESDVAKVLEPKYAQTTPVVSAASLFRMEEDSPLLIPGVNSDHAALVKEMSKKRGWKGFVTAIPNCTTTGLAISMAPLVKSFGVKNVFMTSMQATSGAGRSGGVLVLDALDNIVPYIVGEEEKVQREVGKIFGSFNGSAVSKLPSTSVAPVRGRMSPRGTPRAPLLSWRRTPAWTRSSLPCAHTRPRNWRACPRRPSPA
jgi:aspartate-semialdehyde dehydrogenase